MTLSREHIRIINAEHDSYMRFRTIRQLPITIQGKQFKIDVAVGPITDDFIIGLDFLLEHHCIVNVMSSIVTLDGDTVYAVMKKGSSGRYNVSRVQVTQRTIVPPNHRANIMMELTSPTHVTYVTAPELTHSLITPSCLICGGEGPVVIKNINDSNRQVVLKQGDLLTQAIELDEILTTDTESQNNVCKCPSLWGRR